MIVIKKSERLKRKEEFIKELAKFLVGKQAHKSILLAMPSGMAKDMAMEWAALRDKTPLHGYPTIEEAEEALSDFLG